MLPFLSSHGVLGLNARNLLYIKPWNPRKAVAFADDKMKTKAFLSARGIPTAKIFARIESRAQLQTFDFSALPDACVLKPNYGSGGEGIIVLNGRKKREFLVQGKTSISDQSLREHIEDILDGKFAVNGRSDTAFFERLLVADEALAPLRPAGLPDVRIVVFNLVPVMAMLRVPTAESGGKANVHLGGLGIGIDIAKGTTTYATQYNRRIKQLPHGISPSGFPIPRWEELLLIASRIQSLTNIGYIAVDLTLDAEQGPVLLEVNARAGLMVQVANLAPLRSRLERVEGLKVGTPEKGVRIAKELFGEKTHERRAAPASPERPVLGLRETIILSGDGANAEVPVMLSTKEERTIFSPRLVKELLEQGMLAPAEDGTFRAKFTLGGRKIQTIIRSAEPSDASVRAIIGRRDLQGFLIDPGKASPVSSVRPRVREDLRAIDKFLADADHDLMLLKELKPLNLAEERVLLEQDMSHNPVFRYTALPDDVDDLEARLTALEPDDTPLGLLLRKKRRELLLRITLLRARGDARRFTEVSGSLFGMPTAVLVTAAAAQLRSRAACDVPVPEKELLSAEQAAERFTSVIERYGLHEWKVGIRTALVADCTVGGNEIYIRRGARFSRGHIDSLIAHEIETHVLTAENGSHQPFELFRRGFAHYLDTQEGLAIYNQNRILSPHHEKRFGPPRSVLAVAYVLEHSFAETRKYLTEELGYEPEKALTKTIDCKRGIADTSEPGGFTKGLVYFRGLRAIEAFVTDGGDLRKLYVGKVALEDIDLVPKIPGVRDAILLPEFLRGGENSKKKV